MYSGFYGEEVGEVRNDERVVVVWRIIHAYRLGFASDC